MLRYSMYRCIFPYFLSSPHLFSIYRNRLRLECWWKYLSGATVTKATFLSTKNVLDIGGITTMYVITRRIQYMQFIITTLKHSWDKESNKKKYATTVMYSQSTKCLKITEKVSFNIASEANYIYILSGQKFIKKTQIGPLWRVFKNLKLAVKQCYQTGQF